MEFKDALKATLTSELEIVEAYLVRLFTEVGAATPGTEAQVDQLQANFRTLRERVMDADDDARLLGLISAIHAAYLRTGIGIGTIVGFEGLKMMMEGLE